jgi:hypothetical protein
MSGKEEAYEKIRGYSDSLPVSISNCKACIGLFFKDLKIRLRIFFKKSSNFSQKAQPFQSIILGSPPTTGALRSLTA